MMNYSDTTIATTTPFLSLENVRKTYPGVVALDGFSMEVRPGEVIGLVGENGAGKSTLMKILGGVTTPDTGTITVDGTAHKGLSVEGSLGSGIAFVHQELNLFENLDVAANIFFGREPLRAGPLKLVDRTKLREMVAPLLKRVGANFSADTQVAALSLAQQQMVEIAKALSIKARLVILDEPTSSLPLAETDKLLDVIKALKADGISVIFISHRLHEVERVADRVVVLRDGMLTGILLDLSIAQNISLPNLPAHAKRSLVSASAETATAETQKKNLGIKAPSVQTRTGTLSGGNQQKVVLGKWLAMNPKVMILDEPTRGIDIGAKAEIYGLMRALAAAGVAVLMISSDMEEVIGVSDRIAVMHEGQISGILDKEQFSQENVLLLAVGKQPQ